MPTPRTRPSRWTFSIERTWEGAPAAVAERASVRAALGEALLVEVEAPWHGNPLPSGPPGTTPRLWDFDVVELFLAGDDARYLEIELGPGGHALVLQLQGRRTVVRTVEGYAYRATRAASRWTGTFSLPRSELPAGPLRANAFAIHGVGAGRRFLCATPTGGDAPDFHRLDAFLPLDAFQSRDGVVPADSTP